MSHDSHYHQSSTARSSHSSHRYSPYAHSPAPISSRPWSLQSEQHLHDAESHSSQHYLSSTSDDQQPSIRSMTRSAADNCLRSESTHYPATATSMTRRPPILPRPPPYSHLIYAIQPPTSDQAYSRFLPSGLRPANHISTIPPASVNSHASTSTALHSSTSSMTEYPLVSLVSNSQDGNYTTQPSTSTRRLEPSSYQHNWWPQPVRLSQLPFPQGRRYSPPPTNIGHSDRRISIPVDSLLNPQSLPAVPPSISANEPKDSTHQDYSVQQRLPQGRLSTRREQSYYGEGPGMFKNSQNFSVTNSTFVDNSTTSDSFMREFLQHTIIGAEFDSSDRHPPPRCHPGTRLKIIERCKMFIVQCDGQKKMRWVVGPAGVGKSAVMQIVAEEIPADASVFFSVNRRKDGTKLFTTIAYQLAVKCQPYRQFIQNEISNDPTLLRKALPVQFQRFIVDPFIHQRLFNPSRRFVVIIDGLDECDNPLTQLEILELISDFCLSYPTSPIVWIVASRPEPHLTSFFDDEAVTSVYTKEEIIINSDEAYEDVQRYLRDELKKVKRAYPTLRLKREWPSELEFTKIATAAGGLFAYAATVVRYIGDAHYQDPVAQLHLVLEVIDASLKDDVSGRSHPMAQLDALYKRILSNVPVDVMVNTRKLLLMSLKDCGQGEGFRFQCNQLELTEDAAYGAVRHLHAVVEVPAPDEAEDEGLGLFHKSFSDFLLDFKRSEFSRNYEEEVDQLNIRFAFGIVAQAPVDFEGMVLSGEGIKCGRSGRLNGGPGFCDSISLSWPGGGRFRITDDQLRRDLYSSAMDTMCRYFHCYGSISWFHHLTTRFNTYDRDFPVYSLRDSIFGKFRAELMELGKLKQVPLRALDYAALCGGIDLQFVSPIGSDVKCSDLWNPSCKNEDDLEERKAWSTSCRRHFVRSGQHDLVRFSHRVIHSMEPSGCLHCSRRFNHQFANNPDQLVTVFVDSTGLCYVEWVFADLDDGVSEWRYRFCHSGPPALCR